MTTPTTCSNCRFWHELQAGAKASAGILGLKQPRSGVCYGMPPQLVVAPQGQGMAAIRVNTAEGDPSCSLFLPSLTITN